MTVKTDYSRFDIHDELTAPAGSDRLLKSISSAGGSVSKLVGVLAGSPASLRAFVRLRSELHGGDLPLGTQIRIGLAVAEHRGDGYSVGQHARAARLNGLGLDEISKARSFTSNDPKEAALLALLKETVDSNGHPPNYLLEEARECDWTDEQILEAIGEVALNQFQSFVANAAGLPMDQIDAAALPAAAGSGS
jgi:alkylhydroperoxidase family enzyme